VGIYVGIGFSLLLLVKAAGNYSMKPLKTDPLTGSFVPVDDLQYQVSPPNPHLKLVLSIRVNGQNCYGQSDICQYRLSLRLVSLMVARIKEGLNRLERYGTFDVHPSEQRTRFPEDNVNVVFDFSGVTYIDPRFIPDLH
jgi:hypothetical protein